MNASISKAPDHPNLRIERFVGTKKKREKRPTDIIALRPPIEYVVHNHCINTLERAAKERLFFVSDGKGGFVEPPKPASQEYFNNYCRKFTEEFSKHVQYTAPLTKDEFLGAYKGRRRTLYENAFKSLSNKALSIADSFVSFFLKTEKINKTSKPDPAPRGISPRTPRYHVSLGPYIKKIEHIVYRIIATVFGATTVFKGLNAQARGKQLKAHWDHFDDPVAISLDASRFDQHVSLECLTWEHSIYKKFFPHDKKFSMLLRWQLRNTGYGREVDGNLKFKLRGKRMSGDMNTALGNCLDMCAMVYSFMHYVGIKKFRLANDGDDCVLFIERKELQNLRLLSPEFIKLGFDMKIGKPVDVFEEIEFCQAQPIMTPEGCIMVRKYAVSQAKDCLSVKPLNSEKLFKRWMCAVGECGMSLTGGIPVFQDFYAAFIRTGGKVKPLQHDPTQETGLARLAEGMKREYSEITPETRLSFWKAFGIDPARQMAIEHTYRNLELDYSAIDRNQTTNVRFW